MERLNHTLAALLACFTVACGGSDDHSHDDHSHDDQATDAAGGGHVHVAPRGGMLVVLAQETAHAEVLYDARTGRLDVYLLGAHAVNPLKSSQRVLRVQLDGEEDSRELKPVANPLSGDTVGSTSHFSLRDPSLAGRDGVAGTLGTIEVLGRRYQGNRFP